MAARARSRALADDPGLVVRRERLLAVGQRPRRLLLPGRRRRNVGQLPPERGPVGVRRERRESPSFPVGQRGSFAGTNALWLPSRRRGLYGESFADGQRERRTVCLSVW